MKKSKGFTLIELLVVVAIIGLLSSIILVGLKSAREKAKDGAIMRELAKARTVAQIIFVDDGEYNALCASNTLNNANDDLDEIENSVLELNGNQPIACYADADAYCVSAPLAYGTNSKFCIDGEGVASTVNTNCTTGNKKCRQL